MALLINEYNGVFMLEGAINSMTAQSLKKHMNTIMLNMKRVTINIEKVGEIDLTGLSVLRELYVKSKIKNQSFDIIGYGCKEIYDDFMYKRKAS